MTKQNDKQRIKTSQQLYECGGMGGSNLGTAIVLLYKVDREAYDKGMEILIGDNDE